MALLETSLPTFEFREAHSVCTRAAPSRVFEAIKQVTVAELPVMRSLLGLRAIPALVSGRRSLRFGGRRTLLESALRAGFVLLAESPDREVVVGAIGQPWNLRGGESVRFADAGEFECFARPGYVKIATNFLLQEGRDGTTLSTETRIHATDSASRGAFARYWRIISPGSALIRWTWLAAIRRRAEMG